MPNLPQSPDIGQNSGGSFSNFQISSEFLKKKSVTKLDKRNKTTSKNFGDDVMSTNCDVILIFLIYMANLENSGRRILDA